MPADLQPLSGHRSAASDRSGYDRSLDEALAEMPLDVRNAWCERYVACDGAETRAEDHLHRAEAALQVALRLATIRTVWMLVADRAGTGGADDISRRGVGRYGDGFKTHPFQGVRYLMAKIMDAESISKAVVSAEFYFVIASGSSSPLRGPGNYAPRQAKKQPPTGRHLLRHPEWGGRKGNCWDNAPMGGFFGSLKTELDGDGPFETR